MEEERILLDANDLALKLHVSVNAAKELIRNGTVPSIQVTKRFRRVPLKMLEEWIAEQVEKQGKGE